jgi:hypothetical protein
MDPITMALIGAGIGGVIGGVSTKLQSEDQKKKINQQKGLAEDAYRYQRQYQDASFYLQKEQALDALGNQKNRLAQALGADVAGFNLGLESQALDRQAARISLAGNTGSAEALQGMSGTRDNGALRRNIAYEETAFSRREDLADRSNSLAMANMARQYSNQFDDIGREMDSWQRGGWKYQAKELGDTYAARMHGLDMRRYDYALGDAEASVFDYAAGILGGAKEGAGFAMQIAGLMEQAQIGKDVSALKEAATGGLGSASDAMRADMAAAAAAGGAGGTTPWGNNNYGVSSWQDVFGYYSDERNTDIQSIPFLQGIGLSPEQVSAFDSKMGEFFRKNDRAGRRRYTEDFFTALGW